MTHETDPLREYEEAHERLLTSRMGQSVATEVDGEHVMMGFSGAQTLGPYIAAEAHLLDVFGEAIGYYRGPTDHRDAMRLRFGRACQDLSVELLSYSASLTFLGYDLPNRLRKILETSPLAYDDDSDA